ncbi:MAG: serine/threonine protein kinase [Clostridia bacterium]|nr:serine/threonine protein kinase [Clostridia bacterium]
MTSVIAATWPEWKPVKVIGEGSFGKVYLCTKKEHTLHVSAAVKVITIPKNQMELERLVAQNMSQQSIREHYLNIVDNCVNEIQIMETVKGAPHIVHIEDFKVIERTDAFGWYILIRMELLKSLPEVLQSRPLTYREKAQIGIDMCTALSACHKNRILHRDVKPANIMMSKNGGYKLADFGISFCRDITQSEMDLIGTSLYMAPESFTSTQYNERADIYSLGLVLYQLFNQNYPPFIPIRNQEATEEEKRYSIACRRKGQPLSLPMNAGPAMAQVILTACAFSPENRFVSAEQMRLALMSAQQSDAQNMPHGGYVSEPPAQQNKKSVLVLSIIAAALSVLIIIMFYLYFFQ